MYWVASLDRGWPSGMRGSRDSANDFTSMVPLDPAWTREMILNLMEVQEKSGWFPRQYSAAGRLGKHDLRGHVDAGCWVLELIYEYLCYTKDMALLEEEIPWLDSEEKSPLLVHMIRTVDYYIQRRGEHGLCLIGEGDWLDSVNRAGLEGRGESVMVSNQLIIAITYLEELSQNSPLLCEKMPLYTSVKKEIKECINKHAYNADGYYNSVFTDGGYWIFSNEDPDGKKRVYGPANWYSIASGVASKSQEASVFNQLPFLKKEMGYALYHPPMGQDPIDYVGRSGSGDMPAGLWENGNVYNQGSHGFLGRALAVAGEGNLLHQVLRYMLPFDQDKHPSKKAMTPPYAVVNCWQQVPGYNHRGGLSFLTGSTAMALRMVYDWIYGIQPRLDGLLIDPCLSEETIQAQLTVTYLDTPITVTYINPKGHKTGVKKARINGQDKSERRPGLFSGRSGVFFADSLFTGQPVTIEVWM